jgi:two-component system chemotaxis response regulator CheB
VIRLLVVDDSALMRKLLQEIFLEEGDFEVRVARNGLEALELVRSFDPQVTTLDVQMPDMDGLACLSRIMLEAPRPVVMVSALTEDGAEATLEAMALGAIDFVAKPTGTVSLELERLRPLLVQKVRAAAGARIRRTLRLTERIRHQFRDLSSASRPAPRAGLSRPETGLVLIGASTGGPVALDLVLPLLPGTFPWPVLVAQHMPKSFTGPFAKRLDRQCALETVEVGSPMPVLAGKIYIGRGDADLIVARRASGMVVLPTPAQRDYPWHPSVERMVTSALDLYEPSRLLGVLLTGMGRDGADAMTRLSTLGGRTIAEAESTAVVWGMPGELVKNGGATLVRPIDDIAAAILDMVERDAPR